MILTGVATFGVVLAALTCYGLGTSIGNVAYNATLQTTVPNEIRGRVLAVYDVLWSIARLASIGLGGVLADTLGIAAVCCVGAALLRRADTSGFRATTRAA